MKAKKILVSLVAMFALAVFITASVSAFANFDSIEVSGVNPTGRTISVSAGQTIPVRVVFTATNLSEDIRVKARLTGEKEFSVSSDRFDILAGNTYSRLLAVQVPYDIDPSEKHMLVITVENDEETISSSISLELQRESYTVEVLSVDYNVEAKAGQNLALDIVLKNRGRHFAEDTYVKARIPALGIEQRSYFGDLSDEDQSDPDKEDAVERRMYLSIPSDAKPGVYTLELEVYNADSTATISKKVAIVGSGADSIVVSSANSKRFAAGTEQEYTLTLVNSGDKVKVYQIALETTSGLTVNSEESIVAVPAGESKTVKLNAVASKEGNYNFAANVYTDGNLVKKESFVANVEGSKTFAGNAAVLLTVILAIVFVVLLVILIVLLTRKPAKTEEFGESYY